MDWYGEENQNKFFYSIQHILGLGNLRMCEKPLSEGGADGQYILFTTKLVNTPIMIPVGICMPKECSNVED